MKDNGQRVLSVQDLCIEFHDHDKPERVVDNVSFTLDEGEILGIVGESGSGKSMTALAIAGLLKRHALTKSGEISFDGVDLMNCSRERLRKYQGFDISIIFQEPMTSLDPLKRVGWQVEESMRSHKPEMDADTRKALAIRMLESMRLPDPERVYRAYPHELSGGMRQRVMIAAAMALEPRILIADEPTTALDVTVQAQIIELLKELNMEKGTSILFISHDLSLVRQIAGRVIVMNGGRVVESGTTEQVFSSPSHEYTKRLIAAIPEVVL